MELAMKQVEASLEDEYEVWRRQPVLDEDDPLAVDPIQYWQLHVHKYPVLAKFAIDVLTIPAAATDCLGLIELTVSKSAKEHDKLHTKVKHIDIHQLWIRQEVTALRINVKWVPTDRMPADGLTKVLPKQKFVEFIRQLRLVDIAERLKGLRQANGDDLDGIYIH
ncbi:Dimer-Tnp-hAT domain containing protein [Pyrenophora teres f. maculata]|nr:Dimer-Tnp-hAT domain containing protein [Pyrenophora teres f. maculata]